MGSVSLKFNNDILFLTFEVHIRTGYEGQVKVKVSQRPNAVPIYSVLFYLCVSACLSERTSFGGWDIENGW